MNPDVKVLGKSERKKVEKDRKDNAKENGKPNNEKSGTICGNDERVDNVQDEIRE